MLATDRCTPHELRLVSPFVNRPSFSSWKRAPPVGRPGHGARPRMPSLIDRPTAAADAVCRGRADTELTPAFVRLRRHGRFGRLARSHGANDRSRQSTQSSGADKPTGPGTTASDDDAKIWVEKRPKIGVPANSNSGLKTTARCSE